MFGVAQLLRNKARMRSERGMLSHRSSHTFGREGAKARRVRISGPFADQARPLWLRLKSRLLGAKNKIKNWVDGGRFPGGECASWRESC
jgi:hypothetical protein